jgi:hypothetical protein
MNRKQGPHAVGMRPAVIASGRRQRGREFLTLVKEAEA